MNNKYNILFIDDNCKNYLPSLEPVAQSFDFSIISSQGVLDGLEYLKEYGDIIDAVILDITFPQGELQGIEGLKKIKLFNPLLPVIMLTDSDRSEDMEKVVECMKSGALNYVGKRALNPSYLFQLVNTAVTNYKHQLRIKNAVAAYDKKDKHFTLFLECNKENFRYCGILGFTLLSVCKPADASRLYESRQTAADWHINLLKALSGYFRAEMQVNLKFISNGKGGISTHIIFSFYETTDDKLNELIKDVYHDIDSFFCYTNKQLAPVYIFNQITDEKVLKSVVDPDNSQRTNIFFRKPLTLELSSKFGFHSGSSLSDVSGPKDNSVEIFPPFAGVTTDNELFTALQNQKGPAEIDVLLIPVRLSRHEGGIVQQVINKPVFTNVGYPFSVDELKSYVACLKTFMASFHDKFFVRVMLKQSGSLSEHFLNRAIHSYFFGSNDKWVNCEIKENPVVDHFSLMNSGAVNRLPFIYSIENVIQAFRLPLPEVNIIPGFMQQAGIFSSMPENIALDGLLLGRKQNGSEHTDIRIDSNSVARHIYIMGQTGTGKTTLIKTIVSDCLKQNEGLTVIDPHGDLVDDILKIIPSGKKKRLLLINPADIKNSVTSNLLQYNPEFPQQKSLLINELFKIFEQKYDMKHAGGPMFELYFRNALSILMDESVMKKYGQATLKDLSKFFYERSFANEIVEICDDSYLKNFFYSAFDATHEQAWQNWGPYITSKVNRLINDEFVAPFVAEKSDKFDFRKMMDDGMILLVKLDKGKMGSEN